MKDILIEIKNNLQGNNSRVVKAKNQINDLEHKETKNNQSEQQEENRIQKNEDSVSSLWDNFKHANIHTIGMPEKRKSKKLEIYLKKIMEENFPSLVKEIDIQVQEAQRIPNKIYQRGPHQNTP